MKLYLGINYNVHTYPIAMLSTAQASKTACLIASYNKLYIASYVSYNVYTMFDI